MSRPDRLLLVCVLGVLATGGLATAYLFWQPGSARAPLARGLSTELLLAAGLASALTLANLILRFFRWQFGLRRLGARIATTESLAAFMGSFAFAPVPLLLGQLVARRRTLPEPRPSASTIAHAFVWERWHDIWALAALALLGLPAGWNALALGLVAIALVPPLRFRAVTLTLGLMARVHGLITPDPIRVEPDRLAALLAWRAFGAAAAASLLAWGLTAASFALLLQTAGVDAPFLQLCGVGAAGILGAGLSLVPMGVAVSGFVLLGLLEPASLQLGAALDGIFVHRVTTVWLSVVLGALVFGLVRAAARSAAAPVRDHFDDIDACYDSWLPEHYRDHMVTKKVDRMREAIAALGDAPRGLDLGCGRGWYIEGIGSTLPRASVVGIDLSRRQLDAAQESTPTTPLAQASLLQLPFPSGVYDFAYSINVVHHLPSREAQRDAFAGIAEVLRPGGLCFLHEMNIRNPLFRGYLSYLFPILKGIDEGVEHFLDPRTLPLPPTLELISVDYFTFVPDLCPEALLPAMRHIEARLEASPLAPLGAHFMAVLRRCEHPS